MQAPILGGPPVVRIFVGNLGIHCNEAVLRSVFENYGKVEEIAIARNYALVVMADERAVMNAMRDLSSSSWYVQPLAIDTPAVRSAA